jgi:glycosyltransferase involved in cell wall biosynthesis
MAVGLPVIATNWGGPADYLDNSCGILVDPVSSEGFIDKLASAMLHLARNPDLRASMGAAGRRRIEQEYDWRYKTSQMLEFYDDAIVRSRGVDLEFPAKQAEPLLAQQQ